MMTRNHAYMDMHRMMETDAHADNVADVFFNYEPIRVFRHIARHMPKSFSTHCYIDGCNDIVQHKMAFRTHMCSLLQGKVTTLADHINDHRAGFADGSHMSTSLSASAVATHPDLIPSISELTIRMAKMRPKGLGESNLGGELFAAAPHQLARI